MTIRILKRTMTHSIEHQNYYWIKKNENKKKTKNVEVILKSNINRRSQNIFFLSLRYFAFFETIDDIIVSIDMNYIHSHLLIVVISSYRSICFISQKNKKNETLKEEGHLICVHVYIYMDVICIRKREILISLTWWDSRVWLSSSSSLFI